MVFGQAPCSAGRKKWRHGAYLGLLPAPQAGESDITDLYVQKYGQPEPGSKVFIRTRQQKDGWEGREQDVYSLVPVKLVAVVLLRPIQIRNPNSEIRRKPEIRDPLTDGLEYYQIVQHQRVARCTREWFRITTGAGPKQCRCSAHRARGLRGAFARLGGVALRSEGQSLPESSLPRGCGAAANREIRH